MEKVSIIGLDLAKNMFQAHGACTDGSVGFRKKLSRNNVLMFFAAQPRCVVAMEACASSHFWARKIGKIGHEVKMIPPIYVKPFVKRQKNDAADAEAIAEAASRPTMRFVAVKSEEKQALGMAFRVRDLFVRQRTQAINALRGHLAEYGVIAPQGIAHLDRLIRVVVDPDNGMPEPVVALASMMLDQIGRTCVDAPLNASIFFEQIKVCGQVQSCVRECQKICARAVLSDIDEPFPEDDGELCFCLEPFTRRSFPRLGRVTEDEI